jgi:hypothetical protein
MALSPPEREILEATETMSRILRLNVDIWERGLTILLVILYLASFVAQCGDLQHNLGIERALIISEDEGQTRDT